MHIVCTHKPRRMSRPESLFCAAIVKSALAEYTAPCAGDGRGGGARPSRAYLNRAQQARQRPESAEARSGSRRAERRSTMELVLVAGDREGGLPGPRLALSAWELQSSDRPTAQEIRLWRPRNERVLTSILARREQNEPKAGELRVSRPKNQQPLHIEDGSRSLTRTSRLPRPGG